MVLWIVVGAVVIILIWFVAAYNGFVRMRNRVREAWADIEVQLKRRYDLIPNVVETAKGYATHERETLDSVTEARTRAMSAHGAAEQSGAENMLAGALKSLFAVSENYPDLKANANFLELQRELSDTENKIQAARRFYNSVVRDINTSVESFPNNMVASAFGFKCEELFDLPDGDIAQQNVKVSF